MKHLTLPSVGASFKKWGSCAPILPNFQKKIQNRAEQAKRRPAAGGRPQVASWPWVNAWPIGLCFPFYEFFFPPALHLLRMWSTLVDWLQHMPTLARPYPRTSKTHNFWSVAPRIMKFTLTQSLFQEAFGKKNSKILKSVNSNNAAQNRFSPHRTSLSFRG
jgi:hypothetical protein